MANKDVGIKFLIWTYFNLDGSEGKDEVINRCIDLAYKDATNQGAFNAIDGKGNYDVERASQTLKASIDRGPSKPFDAWHDALCNNLLKYYTLGSETNPPAFSYGNAQKWLNMTIKYLYIYRALMDSLSAISSDSKNYCDFYDAKFSSFEDDFHIPIDSFIMQAIWPETTPNPNWIPGANLPQKGPGAYAGTKHTPWSQFDDKSYNSVQNHIKGQLSGRSPMEWENGEWISVAKDRKDKGK